MKTFENKQKVTHLEYGVGIVQRTRLNGTQGWIDFKGNHAQWFHVTDKSIQKGAKSYTPKPTATNVLAEVQKLQEQYKNYHDYLNSFNKLSDKVIVEMNTYKVVINDLENILQGKSNQ